uniref:Uncharacterized protein n=1 Tax=Peronospora matthiolae TaxID=2874970 RepID=A0AAV1VKN9_9STRA
MASVKEGRLHRWNIIIVAAEVPVDLSSTLDGVCVDSDEKRGAGYASTSATFRQSCGNPR